MLVSTFGRSASAVDEAPADSCFRCPVALDVCLNGDIFVLDTHHCSVHKASADGKVCTFVGNGSCGHGKGVELQCPTDLTVDPEGNVYITDCQCIRKITSTGEASTIAITGEDYDHSDLYGIAMDGDGKFIVSTARHHIYAVAPDGECSLLAGDGGYGFSDGHRTQARFAMPGGLVVDDSGDVIVADHDNHSLRKIATTGTVSTLAGSKDDLAAGLGTARLLQPWDVAVDGDGNLVVVDSVNHCIQLVSPQGDVSTLAGDPGHAGFADGRGSSAKFRGPAAVTIDAAGDVLVADSRNRCLRKIHAHLTPPKRFARATLPSTFHQDMRCLLQSGVLADVTLTVCHEDFRVHRSVLAARSEYFAALFTSNFKEATAPRIQIDDATARGFRAVLHYLYTDEAPPMEEDVLVDVMQLAHRYQIDRLYDMCVRQCRNSLHLHNAVPWCIRAHACHLEGLYDHTLRYAVKHWKGIRIAAGETIEFLADYPLVAWDLQRALGSL